MICLVATLLNQVHAWFLEIDLICEVCVSVCLCVCVSLSTLRLVITSGVILIPYDWLNKFYSFYKAAVVGIVSRRGLTIKARCRNQPNKSKLALYKPLLHYSHLKQPYISNKTKRFSYKGGRGVRGRGRIEAFQRRAGLAYI